MINPQFDDSTYSMRGHFARCSLLHNHMRSVAKYPRIFYVKPSNKVYTFPPTTRAALLQSTNTRNKLTWNVSLSCKTGFSTFLGMLVLVFATSEIYRIFFRMFMGIVLFGLLHGLCILPVQLSLFWWQPVLTKKDTTEQLTKEVEAEE